MLANAGYCFLLFGVCCCISDWVWPQLERHDLSDLGEEKNALPFLVRLTQHLALAGTVVYLFLAYAGASA